MKKLIIVSAAILLLSSPLVVLAADYGGHGAGHKATSVREEVVDGVKATFNVQPNSGIRYRAQNEK